MSFAHAHSGNPGHPQMQQPQRPQHPLQPPPPQTRSATLPAAAAVGVAVGVLAGILVVRGTGQDEVHASTRGAAAAVDVGGEAEAPPAAAAAAEQPEPATPALPEKASLRFEVTPEDAADDTRIFIGEDEVVGGEHVVELAGEPAEVRVVARASGYKTFEQKLTVSADRRVAVVLEKKRGRTGSSKSSRDKSSSKSGGRSGKSSGKNKSSGKKTPGSLIDL